MARRRRFASFKEGSDSPHVQFTRFGRAAREEFFDAIVEAGKAGYDKTVDIIDKERHLTGDMARSPVLNVERKTGRTTVSWGWMGENPHYARYQEYGTGHRRIYSMTDEVDHTLGVSGGAIAPVQSLLRGYLAATAVYDRRVNG